MRFSQILFEHFVNLHTPEQKEPYKDIVWDILQRSYAEIGGFKGAANADELAHTPGLWKLSRRDGEIGAVAIYKDHHGRKAIGFGTDGSVHARRDFHNIKDADVKFERMWVEASGTIEHVLSKIHTPMIPAKYATFLTGKEILSYNKDGYHYTRLLAGHPHEKVIFGVANISAETASKIEAAGFSLHELPDNIRLTK